MREIVLDTETTGLNPLEGDRIVEIGAVELINHVPTGQVYHQYINPERAMPEEAFKVHGLSEEFLRKHPVFSEIAPAFVEFVSDGTLVIHNASFDMAFINAELELANLETIPKDRVLDTLSLAQEKHPTGSNSLDALCRRYQVDNSGRTKHGALLDAELLANVYLELIGGRQRHLAISEEKTGILPRHAQARSVARPRPEPLGSRLTQEEREAHDEFVATLGSHALWLNYRECSS